MARSKAKPIPNPTPCPKCGRAHVDKKGRPTCTGHTRGPTEQYPERPPAGPCKKWPIMGATVCRYHGGSAPQVKAKAAQRLRDMLAEAIDPDRAMRESAVLAYSDIRELFDESGALRPMNQWPDAIASAVSSIKVARANLDKGDGKFDDVKEIKLWDKTRALEMLMKHHGKLVETVEHKGGIKVTWEE